MSILDNQDIQLEQIGEEFEYIDRIYKIPAEDKRSIVNESVNFFIEKYISSPTYSKLNVLNIIHKCDKVKKIEAYIVNTFISRLKVFNLLDGVDYIVDYNNFEIFGVKKIKEADEEFIHKNYIAYKAVESFISNGIIHLSDYGIEKKDYEYACFYIGSILQGEMQYDVFSIDYDRLDEGIISNRFKDYNMSWDCSEYNIW